MTSSLFNRQLIRPLAIFLALGLSGALIIFSILKDPGLLGGREVVVIKEIDGIELDSFARYQGTFIAGAAHHIYYELSNPEKLSISDLNVAINAPAGIRIKDLAFGSGEDLSEPITLEEENRTIVAVPPTVLLGEEKRKFSALVEIDSNVAPGIYTLEFKIDYHVDGKTKSRPFKIPIAVANVSFASNNSAATLIHPDGEIQLNAEWSENLKNAPRDNLETANLINTLVKEFENDLKQSALNYSWKNDYSEASMRATLAQFGKTIGVEYAKYRVKALLGKNENVSPALSLSIYDILIRRLANEVKYSFSQLNPPAPEKNVIIALSSLPTAVVEETLPKEFDGLFDNGLIKIAERASGFIEIDAGRYLNKYNIDTLEGFLIAESPEEFSIKSIQSREAPFTVEIDFIDSAKLVFVTAGRGGTRQVSNAIEISTGKQTDAVKNITANVINGLTRRYSAKNALISGQSFKIKHIDKNLFTTRKTFGNYEIVFVPADESKLLELEVDEIEILDAKIEGAGTKLSIAVKAAKDHGISLEVITNVADDIDDISKELNRISTGKKEAKKGEEVKFDAVIPGVLGKDFETLRIEVHVNPLPAVAAWIMIGLGHAVTILDAASYAGIISDDESSIEILRPEGDSAANVGDLVQSGWRIRAKLANTSKDARVIYNVLVDGQSIFGKGMSFGAPREGSYEIGAPLFLLLQKWDCAKENHINIKVEASIIDFGWTLSPIGFPVPTISRKTIASAAPKNAVVNLFNPFQGNATDLSTPHHESIGGIEQVIIRARRVEGGSDDAISIPPLQCTYVIEDASALVHGASVFIPPNQIKGCAQEDMTIFNIPISFQGEGEACGDTGHHSPHAPLTQGGNLVSARVEGIVRPPSLGSLSVNIEPKRWEAQVLDENFRCEPFEFVVTHIDAPCSETADTEVFVTEPYCGDMNVDKDKGENCEPPGTRCVANFGIGQCADDCQCKDMPASGPGGGASGAGAGNGSGAAGSPGTAPKVVIPKPGTAKLTGGSKGPASNVQKSIGENNYIFSSVKLKAGPEEDLLVKTMTWYQNGSALKSDLANVKVFADGTLFSAVVSSDNRYYHANFGAGINLPRDSTIELYITGDIAAGSGKTIDFDILRLGHVELKGKLSGLTFAPTGDFAGPAPAGETSVNSEPAYNGYTITIGSAPSAEAPQTVTPPPPPAPAPVVAPPPPPTAPVTPLGFWEILDMNADWQKVSSLPFGHKVHLIAASNGTPDMRNYLPIKIELKVDGSIVWQATIPNDPLQNCRDATGCSIDGPLIQSSWQGKKNELWAYGYAGQILAFHAQY